MLDPTVIDRNEQPVAILHIIDDETTIGQSDGDRQVFKALVVPAQNDRDRNIVPASSDTLTDPGNRRQGIVESHEDKRDLVAGRSGIGDDPHSLCPVSVVSIPKLRRVARSARRSEAASRPARSIIAGSPLCAGANRKAIVSGFTTGILSATRKRATSVDLPAPFGPANTQSCGRSVKARR
ncbi:MAG TPA: hypothetical protein VGM42_17650 [Rhodopila sp.]